jgi:hypothetical protein
MGSGLGGSYPFASALAVLPNGDVVAGGLFTSAGGVSANRIARWNGSMWSPLGSGMSDHVYALAVLPNGDLVAGGQFTIAGGVSANRIARWNGSMWSPLGSGISGGPTPYVNALAVLQNGDLVAGGSFGSAGGISAVNIARWNGSVWSPLGSGVNDRVAALAELPSGDLVAAGNFMLAGGTSANYIARWNGSTWSPLGTGVGGTTFPSVSALAVQPNGDLVATGDFRLAGAVSANYIARWNGSVWSPLGSGLGGPGLPEVRDLTVLPNGDLVAGGRFTTAGGIVAPHIARWGCVIRACDDIDFNNNNVFPEDQDVIDFFDVLSGAICPTCSDVDFNNNGVFPEDQDVIDFFSVLAGGTCGG